MKFKIRFILLLMVSICKGFLFFNSDEDSIKEEIFRHGTISTYQDSLPAKEAYFVEIDKNIYIKDYHKWVENFLIEVNGKLDYSIDEYILAKANPGFVDSLKKSDYYYLKEKGIISYDPKEGLFLGKGTKVFIPDSMMVFSIKQDILQTRLDINIPEFLCRVYQYKKVIDSFYIRIGKNEQKYLAMAGKVMNLKTRTGEGKIVRINKEPQFINPVDNKKYTGTKRDDGIVTQLPNIPWLETELDGVKYGQMIHPTTNKSTIGKAASNGCIGLRESDMWALYFYAPVNTPVRIRYDLKGIDSLGNTIYFKDIYSWKWRKPNKKESAGGESVLFNHLCYCGKD
ncbi:MAG: L,D-transpeptidase [Saprospiraceae bacterium]|nr:L,D-transpeptidase [Saprospiraceae bacterium]MBK8853132.1 L,D-transpeptidase [Saprospiraceae bacterium]